MSTLAPAIAEIVSTIWSQTLGIHCTSAAPGHGPRSSRGYVGIIQIAGAWDGTVILRCSESLARRATTAMMGIAPDAQTPLDVQETLAELANMTGGNIKALLPEPCTLGLPVIVQGSDVSVHLPGSTEAIRCDFDADGDAMAVSVKRRVTAGAATPR